MRNYSTLLPETQSVLNRLCDQVPELLNHFVLSGGSALTIHLKHRQSEDLVFISFHDWFDKGAILNLVQRFETASLLHESDQQVDMMLNGVKVTFFNAGWSFLSPPDSSEQLHIATVEQLAAMKSHALFVRARFRDYYDLYVLAKEAMPVPEIYAHAKKAVPGLNFKLFSIALVYTDDIEDDCMDHLSPRYAITKESIRDYFIGILQKLPPFKENDPT